jgi:hypothetical protein
MPLMRRVEGAAEKADAAWHGRADPETCGGQGRTPRAVVLGRTGEQTLSGRAMVSAD